MINYRKLRVSAGLDDGEASSITAHRIKGFDRDGVSFGGATAFLGKLRCHEGEHDCAILIPDLTRHEDVVEVIAGILSKVSGGIGNYLSSILIIISSTFLLATILITILMINFQVSLVSLLTKIDIILLLLQFCLQHLTSLKLKLFLTQSYLKLIYLLYSLFQLI